MGKIAKGSGYLIGVTLSAMVCDVHAMSIDQERTCLEMLAVSQAMADPYIANKYKENEKLVLQRGGYQLLVDDFEFIGNAGNVDAQMTLGAIYENGVCGVTDGNQARHWYEQAAQQGRDEARYRLGLMYLRGQVVEKDPDKAEYWLTKSAEAGSGSAQLVLGQLYADSRRGKENLVKGLAWLTIVAEQRKTGKAVELRDKLRARMTPRQIRDARVLIKSLKERLP